MLKLSTLLIVLPFQHALRLIAFRQIHKVLGMDPLPPPKFTRGPFPRKRRRDNSTGEGNDSEGIFIPVFKWFISYFT